MHLSIIANIPDHNDKVELRQTYDRLDVNRCRDTKKLISTPRLLSKHKTQTSPSRALATAYYHNPLRQNLVLIYVEIRIVIAIRNLRLIQPTDRFDLI
jgi:hypothetical protein